LVLIAPTADYESATQPIVNFIISGLKVNRVNGFASFHLRSEDLTPLPIKIGIKVY